MAKLNVDAQLAYLSTTNRRKVLEEIIPSAARNSLTWLQVYSDIRVALNDPKNGAKLQECDPETVYNSILTILRLGLSIGGASQQAFLVPYGGVCQAIIGWRGKVAIATRSGGVRRVTSQLVYEHDVFELDFVSGAVVHKLGLRDGERGKEMLVWAAAWREGLEVEVEVTSRQQYAKVVKDTPAHREFPGEMWRKFTIGRLLKRIPLDHGITAALDEAERIERGEALVVERGGRVDVIDAEVSDIDARAAEAVGIEPEPVDAKPEPKAPAKRKPAAEPAPASDDDGAP